MRAALTAPLLLVAAAAPAAPPHRETAPATDPVPLPALPLVVVLLPPPEMPPPLISPPAPIPPPPTIPDPVRAVIEAAIASGDPGAVTAVVRFTKQTNPDVAALIDVIDASYRSALADAKAREERERMARLASAGWFEMWKGNAEIGASRSTGNTDSVGLYGALTGERDGILWRHRFNARADLQRVDGVTTTERWLLSWQPNYKLGDRVYAYGFASFEHDRLLGYDARYTLGTGLGYNLVRGPRLKLEFEGGPAVRRTDPVEEASTTTLAGRASLNLRWQITPDLEFTQVGSVYYEPGDSSAAATTSLDTRLIGQLKARFSYDVKYERDAPDGAEPLDTTSRATLVYSF